jgi:small-conductance mechanosensitive channel
VVIVEGEWGRIEEITLTYIVLRIWDQRRLVIPINHFIEKPFQNWTRTSADLIGSVFIYTDYSIPVDSLRNELKKILKDHPLWDKRVCILQVTNTTDKSMELRALMSTEDSSKGWDLRCDVREQLIRFIQNNYPESLPRIRIENKNNTVT